MTSEDCSGPCKVDSQSLDLVSTQIWFYSRKVFCKSINSIKILFKLLEIYNNQELPLYNKIHALAGLMKQIIIFCLKNFTCNNMTKNVKSLIDMILDTEDIEVIDSKNIIVKSIKKYATEIENRERRM